MLRHTIFATVCLFYAAAGFAAGYPNQAITIVVPFGAGTSTDVFARQIASHLSIAFKVPTVIDNKPGAGGMIGSTAVARARANGYTLLMATNTTHSVVRNLFQQVPYDPESDFSPVARVARMTSLFVVGSSLSIKSGYDLVSYARSNPGKIRYGYGNSSGLIAGEMLKQIANLDISPVAYKTNPQALNDVLNGSIEAMIIDLANGLPQIKTGRIIPIGILSGKRVKQLPDVPTLNESIAPGLEVTAWSGLLGPAGIPKDIIRILSDEIKRFCSREDVREKLLATGVELDFLGGEEFQMFLRKEQTRWNEMANLAKIRPE